MRLKSEHAEQERRQSDAAAELWRVFQQAEEDKAKARQEAEEEVRWRIALLEASEDQLKEKLREAEQQGRQHCANAQAATDRAEKVVEDKLRTLELNEQIVSDRLAEVQRADAARQNELELARRDLHGWSQRASQAEKLLAETGGRVVLADGQAQTLREELQAAEQRVMGLSQEVGILKAARAHVLPVRVSEEQTAEAVAAAKQQAQTARDSEKQALRAQLETREQAEQQLLRDFDAAYDEQGQELAAAK